LNPQIPRNQATINRIQSSRKKPSTLASSEIGNAHKPETPNERKSKNRLRISVEKSNVQICNHKRNKAFTYPHYHGRIPSPCLPVKQTTGTGHSKNRISQADKKEQNRNKQNQIPDNHKQEHVNNQINHCNRADQSHFFGFNHHVLHPQSAEHRRTH